MHKKLGSLSVIGIIKSVKYQKIQEQFHISVKISFTGCYLEKLIFQKVNFRSNGLFIYFLLGYPQHIEQCAANGRHALNSVQLILEEKITSLLS